MIRNDFIMRLIELLAVFLARLIGKIESGDFEGADSDIDEMAKNTVGMPMALLESNQAEALIALFTSSMGPDFAKILASAVLLDARGQLAYKKGEEIEAWMRWVKATTLYIKATESPDETIQKRSNSGIDLLTGCLSEFDIPQHLHLELAAHYERLGDYSLAENHMFDGTQTNGDHTTDLMEFYERLLALDDVDLGKGNLTREELIESLKNLPK